MYTGVFFLFTQSLPESGKTNFLPNKKTTTKRGDQSHRPNRFYFTGSSAHIDAILPEERIEYSLLFPCGDDRGSISVLTYLRYIEDQFLLSSPQGNIGSWIGESSFYQRSSQLRCSLKKPTTHYYVSNCGHQRAGTPHSLAIFKPSPAFTYYFLQSYSVFFIK